MSARTTEPLLRLSGIRKSFGAVPVLDGIDLMVRAGEVHALVGENGAGKSTLMHILGGIHAPDGGRIDFNGKTDLRIHNAHHAQLCGIAVVFQERSLFPHLSIAENIFAGRQPVNAWRRIDRARLNADARRFLGAVRLDAEPDTPLEYLAPDQQQLVEVAKALSLDARLIVFDEPTAALTETETRTLFRVIDDLRRRGIGVIYVSHRLEEIFGIASVVTVLKNGQWQGTLPVAETTPGHLVRLMVGRTVLAPPKPERWPAPPGPPRLEVRNLADPPRREGGRTCLRDISFSVRAGEIVGLGGLSGAGRTETALTIIGARERGSGRVLLDGAPVKLTGPAHAIEAGIGYLPEDRKADGIFPEMDLARNIVSAGLARFGSWWMDERAQVEAAETDCQRLRIACRDIHQPISELSGGNQQKCLFSRWLLVRPRVLIVDEPTRGVDVGAKADVHALLFELARQGTALLVISSDLPELLAVSDRIVVLREGRVGGELAGADATEENFMRLASLEDHALA